MAEKKKTVAELRGGEKYGTEPTIDDETYMDAAVKGTNEILRKSAQAKIDAKAYRVDAEGNALTALAARTTVPDQKKQKILGATPKGKYAR